MRKPLKLSVYETYAMNMRRCNEIAQPYLYWRSMTNAGIPVTPERVCILTDNPPARCAVCGEEHHVIRVYGVWCCAGCEDSQQQYQRSIK